MERARAGVIGAIVLVLVNLIFDMFSFPTYAMYGYKYLRIANPLYYFVVTVLLAFGTGLAFAILYIIVRTHIPQKGAMRGVMFGILVWAMTTCVATAQMIAYTALPLVYSVIWFVQAFVAYIVYGLTLAVELEPHAHKYGHPDEVVEHVLSMHGTKSRLKRRK